MKMCKSIWGEGEPFLPSSSRSPRPPRRSLPPPLVFPPRRQPQDRVRADVHLRPPGGGRAGGRAHVHGGPGGAHLLHGPALRPSSPGETVRKLPPILDSGKSRATFFWGPWLLNRGPLSMSTPRAAFKKTVFSFSALDPGRPGFVTPPTHAASPRPAPTPRRRTSTPSSGWPTAATSSCASTPPAP